MARSDELMMVRREDYLQVADRALDAMAEILRELGDSGANERPDLAGANTPYVIVTHCLGVLEYWVGELVAGRKIQRDRAAEFTAAGTVEDLIGALLHAYEELAQHLGQLELTRDLLRR